MDFWYISGNHFKWSCKKFSNFKQIY